MSIAGIPLSLLIVIVVLLVLVVVRTAIVASLAKRYPETRWDWSRLSKEKPSFPQGFLWGVAAAAHQVEGGNENNQWSAWEKQTDKKGKPRIRDGHVAGLACDHWNRYEEDIGLMKELGVSSYRFSVEWSRIEPTEGVWDEGAIEHYSRVIDACLRQGIEPMVTFLHFTHPIWFDELGAFEKEENIPFFVRFCEKVFGAYSDRVTLWCTVNEPEVVSLTGYLLGLFPPGSHSPSRTAVVMRNLLLGHARAYHALKAMPGGKRAKVGLVKNVFQFDPYHRWSLLDWLVARLANRFYNGAILDYLRTGVFSLKVPGLCWHERTDPEVRLSSDFIGLNYYSHMNVVVQPSFTAPVFWRPRPGDEVTDMPYTSYPEGFYRALKELSSLGKPIYVTENGIADDRDDRREAFIRRYLYALSRAIADGVDVRGFYYWSLMDNFEWAEGWSMKFGLYELDLKTQERRLREGSKAFVEIVGESSVPGMEPTESESER